MSATTDDFTTFCQAVSRLTGLDLLQYKRQQMERRIRTWASRRGTPDLTAYTHLRYEIECGGARFVDQEAVRDGKIVCGQTWESHPDFYREVFACLSAVREEATVG